MFFSGISGKATTYTLNGANVPTGTEADSWNAGTYWNGGTGTPYLGDGSSTGTLVFNGTYKAGVVLNSTNDIASGVTVGSNNNVYQLNTLTLGGTGNTTTGTITTVNISGNALDFVANGAVNPTITFSESGINYTVSNNIILSANTTISGTAGSANFSGTLSGTGNLTATSGATFENVGGVSNNAAFAYQGATITESGELYLGSITSSIGDGNFFTTAGLVANSTVNLGYSGLAVSSLTGSGQIVKNSGGGTASGVTVNYVGGTTDTYGNTVTNGGLKYFSLTGPGTFAFSAVQNGSNIVYYSLGTGTLVIPAVSGTSGTTGIGIENSATMEITSATSVLATGTSTSSMLGGTLLLKPNAGSGVITYTGQTGSGQALRYGFSASTIDLNRNGNTGLVYQIGNSATSGALTRNSSRGTLTIAPSDGVSGLGSTEKVQVLGTLPSMANNIWNPSAVTMDTNGNLDFATYITSAGTIATSSTVGTTGDVGFMALSTAATSATYGSLFTNYATSFGSTSNTSVVELAGSQNIALGSSAAAYALEVGSGTTVTIGNGLSLVLGNGSGQAGLILNGGTIAGSSSTLSFGAAEALIYTSSANGTISSLMSGTGGLTKSGLGTLYLQGTTYNSFGTATGTTTVTIDQGALDVGTLTGATSSANSGALPALQLVLAGGVLQGNGTFNRAIATSGTATYSMTLNNGGFAARGGTLTVNAGGSGAQLTWGVNNFLNDNAGSAGSIAGLGVLDFGSNTSNGQVVFQNGIALGATTPNYYREINVTPGAGGDSAELSGIMSDSTGAVGTHGLLKTGNGSLILAGNNTYAGITDVGAGSLLITGVTSGQGNYTVIPLATAGALIGGTGTIGLASGNSLTLSGVSSSQEAYIAPGNNSLNVNAAGTGTLVNNGVTFTTGAAALMNAQTSGGTGALNIGDLTVAGNVTSTGYSQFDFLLAGNTASELTVDGNLTLSNSDTLALSLDGGFQTQKSYVLVDYTGTLTGSFNTNDLPSGYTLSYATPGELLVLNSNLVAAYWKGGANGSWAAASGANFVGGSASSTTSLGAAPGNATDVYFSANSPGNLSTTLDGGYEIHSLNFGYGDHASSAVTIAQGTSGTLTVDAGGINTASGAGAATISAPVALGATQSWTTAAATSLAVSGNVTDGGNNYALSKEGTGTLTLSGSNTYGGGTTVDAGSLVLGNSHGSATGLGALLVNSGGTITGTGISAGSSFSISGKVVTGSGSASDTTGVTTITGSAVLNNSSLASANLTFNLNTANTNSTSLAVGSTGVNLAGATLALNLVGSSIISNGTQFALISGTNSGVLNGVDGSQYTGFTTDASGADGLLAGQYKITSGLTLTFNNASSFYATHSFLFLNTVGGVDEIEVDVVPEPSTWALILSGFGLLVFIRRSRNKKV